MRKLQCAWSSSVAVRGASLLLRSGLTKIAPISEKAWDENENIVGKGDVRLQTRQCFKNIQAILETVGGTLNDLVSITTYFTDRSQLPRIQEVRTEFLSPDGAPASTSVMVAGLGHEDFLVELTPVAVIPHDRFIDPS